MDTAKLASILMTDEYGVRELLDTPGRTKKCIPTLMIPTTAGTGSEATPKDERLSMVSPCFSLLLLRQEMDESWTGCPAYAPDIFYYRKEWFAHGSY